MEIVPKTKKRNTKSYKTELKAMTKERDYFKKWYSIWKLVAVIACCIAIFYAGWVWFIAMG